MESPKTVAFNASAMPSAIWRVSDPPELKPEVRKNVYQAGNGPDQSEQWRNSNNDFKNDEASLQPHHLVPRTGLHHFNIFRTRAAQMLQSHAGNPRQRRRIMIDEA